MRKYISPKIEIDSVDPCIPFFGGSGIVPVKDDEKADDSPNLAGRRRDGWGDLWGD